MATIEIASTDPDSLVSYHFVTTGSARITNMSGGTSASFGDHTSSVAGLTVASGFIVGGTDVWDVSEEIVVFTLEEGAFDLRLNGEPATPAGVVEATGGNAVTLDDATKEPTVEEPPEPTCQDDIQAAQDFAAQSDVCMAQVATMTCPDDSSVTYQAQNGCEISFLESRGWTIESTPTNGENGGTNGSNGTNGGDGGLLENPAAIALLAFAAAAAT